MSAISLIGIAAIGIPAASAAAQDRITAAISSGSEVAIPNSVHPNVRLSSDLGSAPADTKLGMSIRFNLSTAQQAALSQLLADQQNPSSPSYHQWLTPAQFAAQFGLSSADIAKVTAWLTSQGFTVSGVANGGLFVSFNGTVGQAQTAFSTSIHTLSLNGVTHYANVTNVQVPSAFAGVVTTVTGLHNFRAQPHVHTSVVKPEYTSSLSGNHYLAPGDVYTIYNSSPLLNAATPINGAGQTIAVTGQVDIYPADVTAFRSASGLSTTNLPTTILAGGNPGYPLCNTNCTPNQSDLAESSIDVEWSGAMAPSATIDFVTGPDVFDNSMTYAIDNYSLLNDSIITTSYGLCEAGFGTNEMNSLDLLFEQANSQGQTIFAAAGDAGATDCDTATSPDSGYAIEGLAVDYPGSSPNVTSMGGTQFNDGTGTGATSYWSGTNGSTGGSAISYIPESPWNNETAIGGYDFGGGGGGASAYFTKPAWQVGTGVPADGARDVPDLSLNASDAHDSFLYCVNVAADGICTNGFRYASGPDATDLNVAGGTSFDSQIFGGMMALVEQKVGSRFGNINPTIYALANNSSYYSAGATTLTNGNVVFNDVTTGNNAMPCIEGTPNCGNGGSTGFNATNGFDLASGWGSPNVANMAADWTKVTPLSSGSLAANLSQTSLTATPGNVTAGATVTLTATVSAVSGSPGAPTGTVLFLANNTAVTAAVPVTPVSGSSTAVASYSWVTSCSNLGQNVMTASYSGNATYQGSIGPLLTTGGSATSANGSSVVSPVEVQVATNNCPSFALSSTTQTVTVAAGGTIPPVTITATPSNGFTGTVSFSGTVTSTSGYSPTLTFTPTTATVTSTTAVSTSLTLSGITADLRTPAAPGKVDSGAMLAQQNPARTPAASQRWYAAGSGVTIASLLLLVLPRRRRLGGLLLVALAVALVGGATGCGSSQAGPPSSSTSSSNPYAGIYDVNVVGTYTSSTGQVITQSYQVTYEIN